MRCPRCRGFIFDAIYGCGANKFFFRLMKMCMNCGRIWRLTEEGITIFPNRAAEEQQKPNRKKREVER